MEPNQIYAAEEDIIARTATQEQTDRDDNPNKGGTNLKSSRRRRRQSPNISEETALLGDRFDNEPGTNVGDGEDGLGDSWTGQNDHDGLPWWKTPSIYWLLPPFFLFTLAFGGSIVPKLNLILTLICRNHLAERQMADPSLQFMPVIPGSNNPQCQIPEVQALVSRFTLYVNLLTGILSALTTPALGALSDRYGRKYIIALTTLGLLLGEVITIITAIWPDVVSVNWLFLGYGLDGLFGSFTAAMALTHAYAADCTHPAKRNVAFGYFHGCLFTGVAVGPIAAGYIVKFSGSLVVLFSIVLLCHFIFICFLVFIIPESLTMSRQLVAREKYRLHRSKLQSWRQSARAFSTWTSARAAVVRTLTDLASPLQIFLPKGEDSAKAVRLNLILLAAVDATMFAVAMGSMTVVIIYSEYMFGWGTTETSIFVSIVNSGRVLCLLVFLPLITRLVRGRSNGIPPRNTGSDRLDIALIRVAVLFDMMGYLGYALVRTGPLFILSGLLASLGGIGSPTLQSALTKHIEPDRTGELLGAMGLLHALGRVVAPAIFNLIYSLTVGKFTQTVFVCLAATFGVAFALSWFIKPHVYLRGGRDIY
ncbi:MAG: hypothetical protein M1825_001351 [Sarcosagium campestre]|nr:MAG: hypothetical protein M1825_001351 [Sarcosagium campestre]